MISGPPEAGVDIPAAVTAVAAGRPTRAVWRNLLGGLTFEVGGPRRSFVDRCPFGWGVEQRLRAVPDPREAAALRDPPPVDRLVVCHGDACAPNTLLADDGSCCGHVDLAALGVADRWADLAVASYSLGWNYPGQWDSVFFAAYGVEPDPHRIAYYRRLWDASP